MKRCAVFAVVLVLTMGFAVCTSASDIELAKKSTLETILQRGELLVGMEAGYIPFEMADKKGEFIGFDIDVAKEMAKAMECENHVRERNAGWDYSRAGDRKNLTLLSAE